MLGAEHLPRLHSESLSSAEAVIKIDDVCLASLDWPIRRKVQNARQELTKPLRWNSETGIIFQFSETHRYAVRQTVELKVFSIDGAVDMDTTKFVLASRPIWAGSLEAT